MYVPLNAAGPQPVPVARPSSSDFELQNFRPRSWFSPIRDCLEFLINVTLKFSVVVIGAVAAVPLKLTSYFRRQNLYPAIRNVVEYAITLILLVPAAMFVAIAALAVKLTSRGPIFFRQTRVGLGGREFEILKIRSMTHNCERESGAIWSQKGDTRVTPVGRVLRRLHIDELPQLWNVLRRDMSLIGPRPERPIFVAKLEKKVDRYRERLLVRPGVTGLAQVQLPPDSDEADVWQKQAYDLFYIDRMGPWLDLRILLATGLKLFCVPYSWLAKIFRMPQEDEIYHYYWDSSANLSEPTDKVA